MIWYLYSRYTRTLSLSLFLFNLLPLPYLDGAQLLSAILAYFIEPGERLSATPLADLDIERGSPSIPTSDYGRHRRGYWLLRAAQFVTSSLMVVCALLGMSVWIISR